MAELLLSGNCGSLELFVLPAKYLYNYNFPRLLLRWLSYQSLLAEMVFGVTLLTWGTLSPLISYRVEGELLPAGIICRSEIFNMKLR